MSYEKLHRLQRIVMMLMIVALPLMVLPKRFSIPAIGGNMTYWFVFLGMALLIYEYLKFGFKIERNIKVFFVTYIGWQLLCLAHGLYAYEYNELLALNQISKLQFILDKLANHGIILPELIAIKTWLFIRFSKNIILMNNAVFVIAFYVYHVYRGTFEQCVKDMQKAALILVGIMGIYSIVELAWIKTNTVWAAEWLKSVNPFLYDPRSAHGWWPPLLWKGQLRSICPEPSFFGILIVMALPFIWKYYYEAKKNIVNETLILLITYISVMIAATNARTAVIVAGGEVILLVLSIIGVKIYGDKELFSRYWKKTLAIIVCMTIGFFFNLYGWTSINTLITNVNTSQKTTVTTKINSKPQKKTVEVSATKYIEKNVKSVTKIKERSNTARFTNLVANINVIKKHPVMGTGIGLKDAYIDNNLPEFGKRNGEIQLWHRYMRDKGVLKSGYPALNKYADVAVTNGILGLMLYLLLPILIAYKIIKNRSEYLADIDLIMIVISMLALLAVQMSNSAYVVCNGFIWGALAVKVFTQKGNGDGLNTKNN